MFSIKLLGGAVIEGPQGPLGGRALQRRRVALLSVLALSRDRPVSRDRLLALLWPETDSERARHSLADSVYQIRKELGEGVITSTGDDLSLNSGLISSDVADFEYAIERGDLQAAASTYNGPLLDGFHLRDAAEFERWVDAERDRLARVYAEALEHLAEDATTHGNAKGAVDLWRRLAAADPYSARTTLRLMEALDAAGDRAGAIRQARVHATLLEQELGAEPDPEVTALAEQIKAGVPRVAVPHHPRRELLPEGSSEAFIATDSLAPGSTGGAQRRDVVHQQPSGVSLRAAMPRGLWRRVTGVATVLILLAITGWLLGNTLGRKPPEIRRLAVLPFANLSGDKDQEYFVAGMHDILIAELSQIGALRVSSRQSVTRFRGSDIPLRRIARELGVDGLVEGSVFRAGDSIRITVQLVRAEPEERLWAHTYAGVVQDAFGLQRDAARAIAGAVRARFSPASASMVRTADPRAQDAYLQGVYHLAQQAVAIEARPVREGIIRTAIRYLEEAVALDPNWAAAHAQLARAYHWLASGFGGVFAAEYYPKSKVAALRALDIDPAQAQAHASLGFVLFHAERDWSGAERAILRAMELDPNSHHWIYALYVQAAGRYDEAIVHFREALARDPLSEILQVQLAQAYLCAERYNEAIRELRALQIRSADRASPLLSATLGHDLSLAYSRNSMHREAVVEAAETATRSDSNPIAMQALMAAHGAAGDRAEAERIADWFRERSVPLTAEANLILGDTDRAISLVEQRFRDSPAMFAGFRCSEIYRALAGEPRIQAIVRRIGFPN